MKPQEHMDWMSALEVVVDRIDTLERHPRLHAQKIDHEHQAIGTVSARLAANSNDIDAYKKFIGKYHENMDLVITDRLGKLQTQVENLATIKRNPHRGYPDQKRIM